MACQLPLPSPDQLESKGSNAASKIYSRHQRSNHCQYDAYGSRWVGEKKNGALQFSCVEGVWAKRVAPSGVSEADRDGSVPGVGWDGAPAVWCGGGGAVVRAGWSRAEQRRRWSMEARPTRGRELVGRAAQQPAASSTGRAR